MKSPEIVNEVVPTFDTYTFTSKYTPSLNRSWSVDDPVLGVMDGSDNPDRPGWNVWVGAWTERGWAGPLFDPAGFDGLVRALAVVAGPAADDPVWDTRLSRASWLNGEVNLAGNPIFDTSFGKSAVEAMAGLDRRSVFWLTFEPEWYRQFGFVFRFRDQDWHGNRLVDLCVAVRRWAGVGAAEAAPGVVGPFIERLVGSKGVMLASPTLLARADRDSVPGLANYLRLGLDGVGLGAWGWLVDVDPERADVVDRLVGDGVDGVVWERWGEGRGRLRCVAGLDEVTSRDVRAVGRLLEPLIEPLAFRFQESNYWDPRSHFGAVRFS